MYGPVCLILSHTLQEDYEKYKGVNIIRKSKKGRQHNDQQKKKDQRTNTDLQNTTQKTNNQVTRTPLKIRFERRCSRKVSLSCSIGGTR